MATLDLRPARLDIPIARGDDVTLTAAVTGYDLTGATCVAPIHDRAGQDTGQAFATVLDEEANAVSLSLTGTQTNALGYGTLQWSLVATVAGKTRTLIAGQLTITKTTKGAA